MLENILDDYKSITEKLISNIGDVEEVDKLINEREILIKSLFNNKENIERIKRLYLDMGLLQLDKELKRVIEGEKDKVRDELKKIHQLKNANNAYEKNRQTNKFFYAKI